MKIQIIGAGMAGCSIAAAMHDAGFVDIGLYDADKDYTGWAICTGKVFPPKSSGNLAARLMEGMEEYEALAEDDSDRLTTRVFHECTRPLQEIIHYKDPDKYIKKLGSEAYAGPYLDMTNGEVTLRGFQLHSPKAVSMIRDEFPERVDDPDLTIYCRGAWEREETSPYKVTPVRGVTAEITIRNAPEGYAFHWPYLDRYYVPYMGLHDTYQYGTIMMPDKSFGGIQQRDLNKLFQEDAAYMMADWVREVFGAKISMSGASANASVGYRPWVRGWVPGHFVYRDDSQELFVNGLYQSGAQMFFWVGTTVASALKNYGLEGMNRLTYLNNSTKD